MHSYLYTYVHTYKPIYIIFISSTIKLLALSDNVVQLNLKLDNGRR